jgi:hypothetical protein
MVESPAFPAPNLELPPAVVVHAAPEARAALALAAPRGVTLLSAPGAAEALGAPWFLAITADAVPPSLALLDCAAAPGHALAALRAGLRALVLDPGCPGFEAVAGAAAEVGALLLPARPPALDLARLDLSRPAARERLRAWVHAEALRGHG